MIDRSYRFAPWFLENWSRMAPPAALLLLALSPLLLYHGLSLALYLVFLQLPVYMLHQYEEHAHGAFRAYINQFVAGGRDALTNTAIFWINIGGVWVMDLIVLYLAVYITPALGLIAVYLTLLNGLLHIGMALGARRYNPGLWTSLVLFLPASLYALTVLARLPSATAGMHTLGLGVALALHVVVFITIRTRLAQLARQDIGARAAAEPRL